MRTTTTRGDVAALHGRLICKAGLDNPLLENYEELSTVKAPPVVKEYPDAEEVELPRGFLPLDTSLEQTLRGRASRRDYAHVPISLEELSTLLHYAYGVRGRVPAYQTRDFPVRYCPSTGGLQSVELYVVANQVEELRRGCTTTTRRATAPSC